MTTGINHDQGPPVVFYSRVNARQGRATIVVELRLAAKHHRNAEPDIIIWIENQAGVMFYLI